MLPVSAPSESTTIEPELMWDGSEHRFGLGDGVEDVRTGRDRRRYRERLVHLPCRGGQTERDVVRPVELDHADLFIGVALSHERLRRR